MISFNHVWHGVLGAGTLLLMGYLLSANRKGVNWRMILTALAAQVAIAGIVLFFPAGQTAIRAAANVVNAGLAYGDVGTRFMFGGLVSERMDGLFPHDGFVFALRVLPQVIYVSALLSILYYIGIMQVFARFVGKVLQFALQVKEIEAFAAVMTIFLGMVEMPVAIRPYLSSMSREELFTIMASGTASIAGSVLMAYTGLGIRLDYLLAASCMAIPGGLLFAKLLLPTPEMAAAGVRLTKIEHSSANIFEAAATGVMSGAKVALSVSAMLIGFIGIVALMNGLISYLGGLVGYPSLSLQGIFGEVLSPLAWLIGVPWNLCREIGGVIGQKAVFNELVAYTSLGPMIRGGGLDPRTVAISTFALCGFANLASIGVLMGAFGSVATERRTEVAQLGSRAVVAGMLSNLMSGTIAGVFVS